MAKDDLEMIPVTKATLRRWLQIANSNTTSDSDGESYNNDDVIDMAMEIANVLGEPR